MNNNRLCPSCRHPLPTNTCRKCGYKQKKLQIVDTQQQFARFSYLQKIRTSGQELPSVRRLSREEKLSIYLRQYQNLLKKAGSTLAEAKQLNIATSLQLKHQTKLIWQGFLLKKKDINSSIPGIFKKYLTNHKHEPAPQSNTNKTQGQQPENLQIQDHHQKEDQQEQVTGARKRGRRGKSKVNKELSPLTQFRCYYNNSVKPLIGQSTQQRKINQNQLTSGQKAYLSYLLGITQADGQLIKIAGYKYIKMLHSINNHKIQKSYIKENQIASELSKRRLKLMKTKENSSLLLLLYDLLLCWALVTIHSDQLTLSQMMLLYQKNATRFQVIEAILKELDGQKIPENPNIPQISYQLIYAIIYLASIKIGLTISIGEIITCIGQLQISRIQVEEDLYLDSVPNEEVITSERIRRQAHSLACFLQLSFPCFISKWTQKWCLKLDLNPHFSMIELINRMLFKQAKEKQIKSTQDKYGYYRCYQLDQDIASLAGVMVFLKLADGLTDYPYLSLSQPEDLLRQFTVQSSEISSLNSLLKNKQITVKQQSHSPVTKKIPEVYTAPFNIVAFSKRISFLNQFDKQIGAENFNLNLIRLRNLAHLNGVPTVNFLEYFKKCEEQRKQAENKDQIKLRYAQIQHHQWVQKSLRDNKIQPIKITNKEQKQIVELSDNLTNQIGCIISKYEKVVEDVGTQTVPCLIDQPSSNYELMYEYTSDYLMMVKRPQQLWIMEQLCFNNCTYSELTHWLTSYESVLKLYEIQ